MKLNNLPKFVENSPFTPDEIVVLHNNGLCVEFKTHADAVFFDGRVVGHRFWGYECKVTYQSGERPFDAPDTIPTSFLRKLLDKEIFND